MQKSIVIKTIKDPLFAHQCSLNQFGRRKYGSIYELINAKSGVQSTVGLTNGTNVILEEKRKSTHYRSACTFTFDTSEIISELQSLVPLDRQEYVKWFEPDHMCDVIEYLPGDYFTAHKDKKHSRLHYATALIFPPAVGDFEHTGGNLLITYSDGSKFSFDSSKNKSWTIVAFHQELEHECKTVTSGRRVVIKTELNYKYFRNIGPPQPRDFLEQNYVLCDGNLPPYEQSDIDD
jgi:hypothetical protein